MTLDELALETAREMEEDGWLLQGEIKLFAHRLVEKLAKQEPVAWMIEYEGRTMGFVPTQESGTVPVYAAPVVPQVEQEPVYWANPYGGYPLKTLCTGLEKETYTIPLYTHPATLQDLRAAAEKLGYVVVPMGVEAEMNKAAKEE